MVALLLGTNEQENTSRQHSQRRRATQQIATLTGPPQSVARELCVIWQHLTGALAARMWLHNSSIGTLDLFEESFKEGYRELKRNLCNTLPVKSVAGHALSTGQVQILRDPRTLPDWYPDPEFDRLADKALGLVCIPLMTNPFSEGGTDGTCIGTIDMHVTDVGVIDHPPESLLLLGQHTAAAIQRSRSSDRREAVETINGIALGLIAPDASSLRSPIAMKAEFLNAVKDLVCERTNAHAVSIFEADDSGQRLRCCATTGLEHPHNALPFDDITYAPGEGVTGTVFHDNAALISADVQSDPNYKGKYCETSTLSDRLGRRGPFIAVPLPGSNRSRSPGRRARRSAGSAIGSRYCDNGSSVGGDKPPSQADTALDRNSKGERPRWRHVAMTVQMRSSQRRPHSLRVP